MKEKYVTAQRVVDPEEKKICNTAYLLLCLTKVLYTTGKVVILDSDFCDLHVFVALR